MSSPGTYISLFCIYRRIFYAKERVCNHIQKFSHFVCVGHMLFVGSTAIVCDGKGMIGSVTNLISVHSAE